MKKATLLIILIFGLGLCLESVAQVKAINTINFGMKKREVRKLVNANRAESSLNISGIAFTPSLPNNLYNDDGLVRFTLTNRAYADDTNTERILNRIDEMFIEAGYEKIQEHKYYPRPRLLLNDGVAAMYYNGKKYISVAIPFAMGVGINRTYNVMIHLLEGEYFSGLLKQDLKNAKSNNEEVANKLN